jgi:hypothetical protein
MVAAATAPDLQPRDWAPEYPTVSNIAITARKCTALSPMTDWARHGFLPYQAAIRHAFGNRIAHGVITKT